MHALLTHTANSLPASSANLNSQPARDNNAASVQTGAASEGTEQLKGNVEWGEKTGKEAVDPAKIKKNSSGDTLKRLKLPVNLLMQPVNVFRLMMSSMSKSVSSHIS